MRRHFGFSESENSSGSVRELILACDSPTRSKLNDVAGVNDRDNFYIYTQIVPSLPEKRGKRTTNLRGRSGTEASAVNVHGRCRDA